MKTSAVIPAVGISTRMLEMKPLLCFENSTIIRHSIRSLKSVGIQDIIVVTGYQSAVLERHLKSEGVMFIKNERCAETDMLSSVNLGLRALPDQKRQVFVTPADTPLVSPRSSNVSWTKRARSCVLNIRRSWDTRSCYGKPESKRYCNGMDQEGSGGAAAMLS